MAKTCVNGHRVIGNTGIHCAECGSSLVYESKSGPGSQVVEYDDGWPRMNEKLATGSKPNAIDLGLTVTEKVLGQLFGSQSVVRSNRRIVLVATSERLLIARSHLTGDSHVTSLEYRNITGMEIKKAGIFRSVSLYEFVVLAMGVQSTDLGTNLGNKLTGGIIGDRPNSVSFHPDYLKDFQAMLSKIRERISQFAKAPESDMTGSGSVLDMLKKLGELRDAGVLTEEEFVLKKADLLRRI